VCNLAGYVDAGDLPTDEHLAEVRPPVFWGRGARDEVIPAARVSVRLQTQRLQRHGGPLRETEQADRPLSRRRRVEPVDGLAPFLPAEFVVAAVRAPLSPPFPTPGWSWYPIEGLDAPGGDAVTTAARSHGASPNRSRSSEP
jgi:hypothetical protein